MLITTSIICSAFEPQWNMRWSPLVSTVIAGRDVRLSNTCNDSSSIFHVIPVKLYCYIYIYRCMAYNKICNKLLCECAICLLCYLYTNLCTCLSHLFLFSHSLFSPSYISVFLFLRLRCCFFLFCILSLVLRVNEQRHCMRPHKMTICYGPLNTWLFSDCSISARRKLCAVCMVLCCVSVDYCFGFVLFLLCYIRAERARGIRLQIWFSIPNARIHFTFNYNFQRQMCRHIRFLCTPLYDSHLDFFIIIIIIWEAFPFSRFGCFILWPMLCSH